jgi:asparagine synthase (glutamine-hydrolysing)
MCGIAGVFTFGLGIQPIDPAVVLRLNDLQRHRGPDGSGVWSSVDKRITLGHRRLAIIDTGSSGAQPMSDSGGRWVISFNGEIYNYCALRLELERLGCVFLTNSDTEVLINAVAQWGEAGLLKLRGMFAFALWDALHQELWLVRDPYGIKPLYVAESQGVIWFSSQARPLATCAPIETRRDAAALVGFYLWGFVPEPFSWWTGIRMLPAGHLQRIRAGRVPSPAKPYYCIQDSYVRHPARPLASGELRDLVLDSVRHHLVSDVPVGVFLSAGIDSNVIAALAAELGTQLRTVTLAFNEFAGTPQDEAPLAEAAAKALRSDHITVRIGRDEFGEVVDDFLRCMDQPTTDGLNTFLVSRAAAMQGLKVALSGLGGDELFGGYPSFHQIPQLLKWGRRISISKPLGRALQILLRATTLPGIPPKAAGLLSYSGDIATAYLLRRALYLEDELDSLLDESWLKEGLERLSTVRAITTTIGTLNTAGATSHAQISAVESCWYMRSQLLRDTDWSSMAHSLEVRVPFVDVSLLERLGPAIASATPPSKRDLAACAECLPRRMLDHPKTGFTTPVRKWIDNREKWIDNREGTSTRGLRGWAAHVHRSFRLISQAIPPRSSVAAA